MDLDTQRQNLENAVAHALDYVKQHGANAEVATTKMLGISVSTRLAEVENIEFNNDGALGISVYLGQKKGNASTSDLSLSAIEKAVDSAINIAKYTSPDPCAGLVVPELLCFNPPDLDLFHPCDISIDKAIGLAKSTESSALDFDSRIVNSEGASFNSHQGIRVYGNSHGMLQSYLSSRYSLSCSVIAQDQGALERDYEYTISRNFNNLQSALWVGENCAQKTIHRLNPRKIKSQSAPVIFLNDVATGLIGHLANAISGGSLYRQASFLLNSLGTKVLPEWLIINERPHLLAQIASTPFDSEGVATKDLTIINQGVVETYLLTNYSAKKLNMTTTGHAGGIHNWLVSTNMSGGLSTLLKEMGTGLLVTDLMGQGVNLVTGDYSRGVSGFWVENGEIQYPVAEITIAGNLRDMFKNIVAISDDIEQRSNIQTGSILLSSMQISGN